MVKKQLPQGGEKMKQKTLVDRTTYYLNKVEQIWKLPLEKQRHRAQRLVKYKDAVLKQAEAVIKWWIEKEGGESVMDLGWLPEILCLFTGVFIGMFYRDWAIEQYQKEKEEDENEQ